MTGLLRRQVRRQLRARRNRTAGDHNCLDNELRRAALGIKVAQYAVHPGPREDRIESKHTVRPFFRVVVKEISQVLADDEDVIQLLVYGLEVGDLLPGLRDRKSTRLNSSHG